MTVAEMLGRISSTELSEWMAYYSLEPFGEERADLRNAILSSVCAAPHLKRGVRTKLEDYMPFHDKTDRPRQSPEAMQQVLRRASEEASKRR